MILFNTTYLKLFPTDKIPNILSDKINTDFSAVDRMAWFNITNCSKYKGLPLLDRSATLKSFVNLSILDPMPSYSTMTTSFSDLMIQRANQLIATGKPIDMYWSGGIDSTSILAALLRSGVTNIHVYLTPASIAEYPLFFTKYVRDLPHTIQDGPAVNVKVNLNNIIVSGELGDQIFGSDLILQYDRADLDMPYVGFFHQDFVNSMKPVIDNAPIEINSLIDFLWYFNFCFKWHFVKLRLPMQSNFVNSNWQNYFCPFFDTLEFQLWSMNNRDKIIKTDMNTYKWISKEFILDFTGDNDYFKNAIKLRSLKILSSARWNAINSDLSKEL